MVCSVSTVWIQVGKDKSCSGEVVGEVVGLVEGGNAYISKR